MPSVGGPLHGHRPAYRAAPSTRRRRPCCSPRSCSAAGHITGFPATLATGARLAAPEQLRVLTAREREVMAPAAPGRSDEEIAGKLFVSPLTVRTHVHRATARPDAHGRAQLVLTASQSGLVRPRRR